MIPDMAIATVFYVSLCDSGNQVGLQQQILASTAVPGGLQAWHGVKAHREGSVDFTVFCATEDPSKGPTRQIIFC